MLIKSFIIKAQSRFKPRLLLLDNYYYKKKKIITPIILQCFYNNIIQHRFVKNKMNEKITKTNPWIISKCAQKDIHNQLTKHFFDERPIFSNFFF